MINFFIKNLVDVIIFFNPWSVAHRPRRRKKNNSILGIISSISFYSKTQIIFILQIKITKSVSFV